MSLLADTSRSDGAAGPWRNPALRLAVIFLIVGAAWVLGTDILLYRLVHYRPLVARLETAKGWVFAAGGATFLYFAVRKQLARLRQSEATSRAVFKCISDGILLLGRDGRMIDANPAAVRMLGVRDRKALVGMDAETFSRRFHVSGTNGRMIPADRYVSQRALRGEIASPYKVVIFPESGAPKTISSSAAPVRFHPDGPVLLSVSVMRDITESEALERLRDEFFASAAHSLKTPITIIRSHAQLLMARVRAAEDRAALLSVDRQCGVIDRLVQNLLVLSRLESGTMRFHPQNTDLRDVVEQAAREMRTAAMHHQVRVQIEAAPAVFADPERIVQAVKNLIEEALTLSPPETEITLLLRQQGLSAEVGVRHRPWPERTPEPPRSGTSSYSGLGVARHVSEQLTQAQGGRVQREQGPEDETTWLLLPALEAEARVAR